MVEVGIREFRNHIGKYMERVRAGETIVLTERGKRVGRITPEPLSTEDKIWAMVRAGKAHWSGQRLVPFAPTIEVPPGLSLSDAILEDRRAGDDRLAGGPAVE